MMGSRNRLPLYYVVTMLYWFTMYTYVPLLSPYVRHLGSSLAMAGVVIGSYGFTQMLVRIPLGIWSDRVRKRKPFVIAGVAVATASSLGLALTHSPGGALLFRGLAGVAAGSWVVFTVLYASYHDNRSAPRAMGVISFYTSIGQMVASVLGGLVANQFGWHAAFWAGAAGGVIGFFLAFWIREKEPEPDATGIQFSDLARVGRDRIVLGVSTLAILAQFVTFSTLFGFTPQAATHLGATKADLSVLSLVSTLPNAIASIYGVRVMSSRFGNRTTVAIGFLTSMTFTAAIPFIHNLGWLYVTQMFNGFGQGIAMPILMGLSIAHVAPKQRATAMGFFQAIYSLGMFGGPAICGIIGDAVGLGGGFLVVSCISLAAAILAAWLVPGGHRGPRTKMDAASV